MASLAVVQANAGNTSANRHNTGSNQVQGDGITKTGRTVNAEGIISVQESNFVNST